MSFKLYSLLFSLTIFKFLVLWKIYLQVPISYWHVWLNVYHTYILPLPSSYEQNLQYQTTFFKNIFFSWKSRKQTMNWEGAVHLSQASVHFRQESTNKYFLFVLWYFIIHQFFLVITHLQESPMPEICFIVWGILLLVCEDFKSWDFFIALRCLG